MKELSEKEKWKLYWHYYVTNIALKHNFHIVDKTPAKPFKHNGKEIELTVGRGTPDKEFGNIALYYLWKDIKIKSFDEFCKGEVYEWCWKFKEILE